VTLINIEIWLKINNETKEVKMFEYITVSRVADFPKQKELQSLSNNEIEIEITDNINKLVSSCQKETDGGWKIVSHTVQILKTRLAISVLLRRSTRPNHL
jgi:hypothetical protein